MRVIILEDEIPAFNKLSSYLLELAPQATITHWFRSVEDALQHRDSFTTCHLILSDIKLLDGNSFDLFSKLKLNCPIIFCTAYNKYLQDAFDTNGIAYIVKPYSQDTFNNALNKYKQLFANKEEHTQANSHAFSVIKTLLQNNIKSYKQRFSIKKRDGIIIKQTSNVLYFKACGDFCLLFDVNDAQHHINYKISELENLLDPNIFFRINRSEIVNINYIQKVAPHFKNKMQISLPNIQLTTSGSRTPEFRLWLDGK